MGLPWQVWRFFSLLPWEISGEARHGSAIKCNGMFIWLNFGLPPCSAIDNTGVNNDQLIPFFDYFVPTLANVLLIILYWLIFFLLIVLCLASILLIYAPVYMKVFLHWHCFYNVVMAGFYCMLGQYASTQSFALICTQFVYYLVICALQSFYQSCL